MSTHVCDRFYLNDLGEVQPHIRRCWDHRCFNDFRVFEELEFDFETFGRISSLNDVHVGYEDLEEVRLSKKHFGLVDVSCFAQWLAIWCAWNHVYEKRANLVAFVVNDERFLFKVHAVAQTLNKEIADAHKQVFHRFLDEDTSF